MGYILAHTEPTRMLWPASISNHPGLHDNLTRACLHRQLGLKLHVLDPTRLPLYDSLTGELIPEDMDSRVEHVRDTLLDAARERVDTLGEAAVDGESAGYCAICVRVLHFAVRECKEMRIEIWVFRHTERDGQQCKVSRSNCMSTFRNG